MNRRRLASITLLIAVALFVVPLVSPVPAQEPKLAIDSSGDNFDTHPQQGTERTVRYQNLSPAAQQWFDTAPSFDTLNSKNVVPLDSPPEPWATLAPDTTTSFEKARTHIQVIKHGRYYSVTLLRIIPRPPFQAVVMRLGPLVTSIVLFGLAGHLFLTAEN